MEAVTQRAPSATVIRAAAEEPPSSPAPGRPRDPARRVPVRRRRPPLHLDSPVAARPQGRRGAATSATAATATAAARRRRWPVTRSGGAGIDSGAAFRRVPSSVASWRRMRSCIARSAGTRFEAQLVDEPAPHRRVMLQRLGLRPRPVQRQHQQLVQMLATRDAARSPRGERPRPRPRGRDRAPPPPTPPARPDAPGRVPRRRRGAPNDRPGRPAPGHARARGLRRTASRRARVAACGCVATVGDERLERSRSTP